MTSIPEHPVQRYEKSLVDTFTDFHDPSQEWRRLFSELLGTFFLVLVAAGGGMMGQAFPDTISRTAAVVAPGLMVMGIILFMGKVSGAHLNPAVSIAFTLRGDFPWRRVPGYIVVQLVGATLACLFLRAVIDVSATYGSNYPAPGYSAGDAFLMEAVLTLGLVSVILGTASGAQNIGVFGAIGVGALHRARRPLGQPDLGRLDEPRPHIRARPRRQGLRRLLGLRGRPARRRRARGRCRLGAAGSRRGPVRLGGGAGRPLHRGRAARQGVGRGTPWACLARPKGVLKGAAPISAVRAASRRCRGSGRARARA